MFEYVRNHRNLDQPMTLPSKVMLVKTKHHKHSPLPILIINMHRHWLLNVCPRGQRQKTLKPIRLVNKISRKTVSQWEETHPRCLSCRPQELLAEKWQ
jgi:hypothetical protein